MTPARGGNGELLNIVIAVIGSGADATFRTDYWVFTSETLDSDGDRVPDSIDNCPLDPNPDQADFDGDGLGDVCDPDADGDGVQNGQDLCPWTPLGEIVHPDSGCSMDQLNPCAGPLGTTEPWRNHGEYVSSVAHTANEFFAMGLISQEERSAFVSGAARSSCGF